jgi:GT2 family glycosyltransferase
LYDICFGLRQDKYINRDGFAVGANLIVPRNIIDAIGLFDEDLLSGGDREFCHRATSRGFNIIYAESIKVRHPARKTIRSVLSKIERVSGGVRDLAGKGIFRPSKRHSWKSVVGSRAYKSSLCLFREEGLPISNIVKVLGVALLAYFWSYYQYGRMKIGALSPRS